MVQGDPEASALFCVACHEEVKESDKALTGDGGKAVFGNDDGYAMGPPEVVFPAVEKFKSEMSNPNHL